MKQECIDAVKKAAGRDLSKAEIDGIDQRILGSLREMSVKDSAKFMSMSKGERVAEAAKMAKQRMIEDTVRAHEATVEQLAIKARLADFRNKFEPGLKGRVAAVMQQAFHRSGAWIGDNSVEMNRMAVQNHYLSRLNHAEHFGAKGWGFLQDLTQQEALMRELKGEDSGNREAKNLAQEITGVLGDMRAHAERAGIGFHALEGHLPQPTDWTKVPDKETYVARNIDRLDPRAYVKPDGSLMTRDERIEFLKEAHETLATEGANKRAEGTGSGGAGILGGSRNKPRQLHFKDAQSYIDYMKDYGSANNVYSMLRQHMNRLGSDIAIAETYGRQAELNFQQHLEQAFADDVKAVKTEGEKRKLKDMKVKAERMFDVLVRGEGSGNAPWANRMSTFRAALSSVKLGGLFGALQDPGLVMANARLNGIPEFQALGNVFKHAFSGKAKRAAADAGLMVEGMQAAGNRLGADDLGSGAARFLNTAVHKLSGLGHLDAGIRGGVGMTIMNTLGRLSRAHATLDALREKTGGDFNYLTNVHGVEQRHWDVWHAAQTDAGPNGEHTLLTPKAIYDIPDEKLRPLVQDQIAQRSAVFKEALEKAQARTAKENEWVAGRQEKFNDARDRANRLLREFDERRQGQVAEAQAHVDARAELLRATVARAEVEHDIAGAVKTQVAQGRIADFLRRVEDGADTERAVIRERVHPDHLPDAVVSRISDTQSVTERAARTVENYGRSINGAAEALGQRRARAEARIKEAQARVDAAEKANKDAVQSKAGDLDKRFTKHLADLNQFTKEAADRNARRAEYSAEYQRQLGNVEDREIQRAKSDAATKLLSTALTEMQTGARGAMGATIADKDAAGLLKNEAGTKEGEILRTFMHLKAVPVGIFKNHFIDQAEGLGMMQHLGVQRSKWLYRAQYMAYSLALGALGYQLKRIATGQNPEDMSDPKFALKAAVAGGGFGLYGDLFLQDTDHKALDAMSLLAGPSAGMLNDVYKMYMDSRKDMEQNGKYNYGSHLLTFARNNAVPLMNIWYLKGAFNHAIYQQLQERANPGYTGRLEARAAKEQKSFWWHPGDTAPSGTPNLSTAFGGQ